MTIPASPRELLRIYAHTLDRLGFVPRTPGWSPGAGRRPGIATGFSVDFADYRKYNYGDDVRYIDWSIYARLRKLFLRQFRAESELTVHLLLDVSRSMDFGGTTKLEFAVRLAAAFSYVGLNKQDRVGLATFSDDVRRLLPPQRGRRQLHHILALLDESSPEGVSDFDRAFRSYAARASSRGLLILFSDCYSPNGYRDALRSLSFAGFEVAVVRVLAAEECRPEFEEGAELRDLEHPETRGPTINGDVVAGYRRNLDSYSQELAAFCLNEGFLLVESTTSLTFEELTIRLLRAGIWCNT
jgi:uncharacterized protein (DUF58 family)